ncbi:MAG: CDP-alcohol phosphatidyltransferase family protein [Patescibacteria group bacterium]|jgi:phosphatidylglycerophosphate synthase
MFYRKLISLVRKCSLVSAKILNKIGITANQVTIGSNIIFIPIVFYCFSVGSYKYNILGLFFLIIRCYFDFVDGQVARLSNKCSILGEWLDDSFDHFTIYGLIISIGVGMYKSYHGSDIIWLIIAILLGYLLLEMMSFKYTKKFGFKGVTASKELQGKFNSLKGRNFSDIFVGNLIGFWSNIAYFIFGFSYFFLLSVLFNKIFLFLCFFTITLYLRFFAMYFIFTFLLSNKEPKSVLFKFLKEISRDESSSL